MEVKDFRHHLHSHPELSFEERLTSQFISEQLSEMGIEFRPIAGTGILARIEGRRGNAERCVVLRAEMDALPIEEMTGAEFSSQNKGVMHACGHDCHSAMLYGVLKRLQMERDFEGTLLAVFQPAEERMPGGASLVMEENPFSKYNVAAVIGQHTDPELEAGEIGFCPGKFMASADEMRFTISDTESVDSPRKRTKSAVVAMSDLIMRLNTLNSDVCSLSVGSVQTQIDGEEEVESAIFSVKMSAFGEKLRQRVKDMIANIVEEIEYKYDVEVECSLQTGYPCVENNVQLTYEAMLLSESLGFKTVDLDMRMTTDDFGYYSLSYPALFYRLGVGRAAGKLHTATYLPDDKILAAGEEFMYRLALNVLNK
ncbi:MAG: amidohydrolase [Alistipes sp.]|nr:amidohydrolase [Alistipes sp.]